MVDLTPDSFPGFRLLLHRLAALWEPPSTTTPPSTTASTTRSDVEALLRRHAAELLDLADMVHMAPVTVTTASTQHRPRHKSVPTITEDEYRDRGALWVQYWSLKCAEVSGTVYRRKQGESVPTSINAFAALKHLSPSEVSRWMKRRGIASGSHPDVSIRRALAEEIGRIELLLSERTMGTSHGMTENPIDSHSGLAVASE